MKKERLMKLICAMCCVLLACALTACGSSENLDAESGNGSAADAEEEVQEETPEILEGSSAESDAVETEEVILNSIGLGTVNADSLYVYSANLFEDGVATILFSYNEGNYEAFVDETGTVKYYIPWEGSLDDEANIGFANGYSWFDHEEYRYIIDTECNILSSYPLEDVLLTEYGYTWVYEESGGSWSEDSTKEYTLYTPDGEVETSITSKEDLFDIGYNGEGVFYLRLGDSQNWTTSFYFVQSRALVEDANSIYSKLALLPSSFEFENGYTLLGGSSLGSDTTHWFMDAKSGIYYLDYKGDVVGYSSEGYVLYTKLWNRDICYVANLITGETGTEYTGAYAGYSVHSRQINDTCFAIQFDGHDGAYVGLVKLEDLTEIAEPVRCPGGYTLTNDALIVDGETDGELDLRIYDLELNLLSTFEADTNIEKAGDGVLVIAYDTAYRLYYSYDGTQMFDTYDFTDAVDLLDCIGD